MLEGEVGQPQVTVLKREVRVGWIEKRRLQQTQRRRVRLQGRKHSTKRSPTKTCGWSWSIQGRELGGHGVQKGVLMVLLCVEAICQDIGFTQTDLRVAAWLWEKVICVLKGSLWLQFWKLPELLLRAATETNVLWHFFMVSLTDVRSHPPLSTALPLHLPENMLSNFYWINV